MIEKRNAVTVREKCISANNNRRTNWFDKEEEETVWNADNLKRKTCYTEKSEAMNEDVSWGSVSDVIIGNMLLNHVYKR